MAPQLTLFGLLIVGVGMIVMYKSRNLRPKWRSPYGTEHPDSMNAGLQAECAVPRPPWPIDDDGNPIDEDMER